MAPGGTLFRFAPHFGENVLPHGSHEWLPYSKDEVRLKTVNTNLPDCRALLTIILNHPRRGYRNCPRNKHFPASPGVLPVRMPPYSASVRMYRSEPKSAWVRWCSS